MIYDSGPVNVPHFEKHSSLASQDEIIGIFAVSEEALSAALSRDFETPSTIDDGLTSDSLRNSGAWGTIHQHIHRPWLSRPQPGETLR